MFKLRRSGSFSGMSKRRRPVGAPGLQPKPKREDEDEDEDDLSWRPMEQKVSKVTKIKPRFSLRFLRLLLFKFLVLVQRWLLGVDSTPSGLMDSLVRSPRVARSSQPWAGGHNPFGIAVGRISSLIHQRLFYVNIFEGHYA
jgi:hypothetical protein